MHQIGVVGLSYRHAGVDQVARFAVPRTEVPARLPALRGAWEDSRAARTCGPLLDRLMGEALGMARRVRRLSAGVRSPSLGDLAADRVLQHLGGRLARVALLGVSPMTRRCAAVLHEA